MLVSTHLLNSVCSLFDKIDKSIIHLKIIFMVKQWQKMVQSACGYRIHQSILAIFGIFKPLQKQLKLQLRFEKSCQTLAKYILGIEIFQNCLFIKIDY